MALWFATRAFGLVTLTLFSAVVVLGLLTAGRRAGRGAPSRQAFVVAGLHRSLSLLSLTFLGLHVAANVLDDYVTIRWTDAVVPFVSDYHPFWLGLGAIACDVVLVLIITSLLRVRMGLRAWRAVHWLAYACWPIAVVHAIGVGTDRGLSIALAAACALAVTSAAAVRLTAERLTAERRRAVPLTVLPRTDPVPPRDAATRWAAAERVAGHPGPHPSPGSGTSRGSR